MATKGEIEDALVRAASAVREATAILVTAGAGMGVDSGLPDFRGPEGFWAAYPPYRALGLRFEELADPRWFRDDPHLAWGFYGHRLDLYRRTVPHVGFEVLRRMAGGARDGGFAFTSNVDGHFQKAGFAAERVLECHGSLEWLQCTRGCGQPLFPSASTEVDVDDATFRAQGALPACPSCGSLARPNVLMFGDGEWDPARTQTQESALRAWLARVAASTTARLVIVECGAGTAVPTVRRFGDSLAARPSTTLVRINLREPHAARGISLPLTAREGLEEIDRRLREAAG